MKIKVHRGRLFFYGLIIHPFSVLDMTSFCIKMFILPENAFQRLSQRPKIRTGSTRNT